MAHHQDNLATPASMSQALYGARLAVAKVRGVDVDGHAVDLACAVQGCVNVLSYGVAQIPHDHDLLSAAPCPDCEVEIAGKIEELLPKEGVMLAPKAIPWALLIPLFLKLLEIFVKK